MSQPVSYRRLVSKCFLSTFSSVTSTGQHATVLSCFFFFLMYIDPYSTSLSITLVRNAPWKSNQSMKKSLFCPDLCFFSNIYSEPGVRRHKKKHQQAGWSTALDARNFIICGVTQQSSCEHWTFVDSSGATKCVNTSRIHVQGCFCQFKGSGFWEKTLTSSTFLAQPW